MVYRALEVVAEAVGDRLENGEGLHVGLLRRGVHAARREGNLDLVAGVLRGLSRRPQQPASTMRSARRPSCRRSAAPLNSLWMPSRVFSTVASWAGWLTAQSFCGARRMRAPLAPPRLSEPRKVEAEAQAVETSCGDGEAGSQDLAPSARRRHWSSISG